MDLFKLITDFLEIDGKEGIIVGLAISSVSLLIAQLSIYFKNRYVLKEKDKRIEDLVEQRNKFQDIVLNEKGLKRKSTKK